MHHCKMTLPCNWRSSSNFRFSHPILNYETETAFAFAQINISLERTIMSLRIGIDFYDLWPNLNFVTATFYLLRYFFFFTFYESFFYFNFPIPIYHKRFAEFKNQLAYWFTVLVNWCSRCFSRTCGKAKIWWLVNPFLWKYLYNYSPSFSRLL